MKNALLIAMAPLLFVLDSCTCNSGCSSTEPVTITFDGYNVAELDSIKLERFDRGSLFGNKADERFLFVNPNADSNSLEVTLSLREDYDYRVTVLSDNNHFDISEVEDSEGSTKGRGLCVRYTKEAMTCPLESLELRGAKASSTSTTNIILTK